MLFLDWQKDNFRILFAFGIPDDSLSVFDILWAEFQNLADPHAATCHEFEQETVYRLGGPENDLIDNVLFQDFELGLLPSFEKFSQGRIITGVLEIGINRILDIIEKCQQEGEP